jgi:hypothetical protein
VNSISKARVCERNAPGNRTQPGNDLARAFLLFSPALRPRIKAEDNFHQIYSFAKSRGNKEQKTKERKL